MTAIQLLYSPCSFQDFHCLDINPQHPRRENSFFSKLEKGMYI